MDFDATSLYISAMWDGNIVYPKTETGYAFRPHMNDVFVNEVNNQTFNQDGNDSSILKLNFYNPPNLVFQHLPVEEKVEKLGNNKMRNGCITDILTSVDLCEFVKMGGKVIRIYEGVIYQESFKVLPSRKVIKKLLTLRQKYKDEKNHSNQGLVK